MLQGGLKCAVARCELLLLLLLHRCRLLSCCCCCWAEAGHREAGEDAEVAEDHSLAQQRRSVGRLDDLLGLSLLALDLKQGNNVKSDSHVKVSPTFLFLIV